ncbi:MAG: S8 family serine peptidase [Elusimicrobia bacterium]|nr:S8 family serine peptidase [Elusimicrobiota bacterium]
MRTLALIFCLGVLTADSALALKIERLAGASAKDRVLEVVAEELLVKFASPTASAEKARILAAAGAEVKAELESIGWTVVKFQAGTPVSAALRAAKNLPRVEAVSPHRVYRPSRAPNDALVNAQYALAQINAFAGWEFEVGNTAAVTVAVIDSGIDGTQPELSGKLVAGASRFCDPSGLPGCVANNPPTPACNHATRVAGIAAASSDNGSSIAGLSWGAGLVSLKVFADADCAAGFPECSAGACVTADNGIINALNYARGIQDGAGVGKVVVNLSLGGAGACAAPLQAAVTNAVNAGVVVVAAAGNSGGAVESPANCAGVIPVGATDSGNGVAYFSSRGAELSAGGVVAPGVSVLTTDLNAASASASGTSFASPHVAGLAALILSAKSGMTPAQVQSVIRGGADNIGDSASAQGAGRVNAFRALRLAVNGTLAGSAGETKAIAFPNPFRVSRHGRLSFSIPPSLQGAQAKIKIYTASYELVRELTGLSWNGLNENGQAAASGSYIFLISTEKGTGSGRFSVIN